MDATDDYSCVKIDLNRQAFSVFHYVGGNYRNLGCRTAPDRNNHGSL